MAIHKFPFVRINGHIRPYLPVLLKNPDTGLKVNAWALLDTGADNCAIPAHYADILGHDLLKGTVRSISTGNGCTYAYEHTVEIDILGFNGSSVTTGEIAMNIPRTTIDFMPNLNVLLLGVGDFLENYILTINYPARYFTLKD